MTFTEFSLLLQAAQLRHLQADYYAHLLAGIHGNTEEVAEDLRRNGATCFNVTGRFMMWDATLGERTRACEARLQVNPRLGIDLKCWEIAATEFIEELRSAVPNAAEAGDGGPHNTLSPALLSAEVA